MKKFIGLFSLATVAGVVGFLVVRDQQTKEIWAAATDDVRITTQ